ncbi:aminomethyl-transferring glycine dehydrogenase subunit GcvPA [Nitrococcus mobilis]|uniref:Probable glycine dehydrogenase (decarboxylating) subunit 1 n=1 Tax=Nitrococcus mobilis Nb-231 TaxID=314278 RepID=A4BS98_9GAMM|nr:aminomethyl-transferring glycine dehydrogenase subunit GcvPA [Nitrococcus mobilis]EAR21358.1 glycine dehydrogenase subunit 1 [Nitrococcus mobilis Nb-231]
MPFIPHTEQDIRDMLSAIGVAEIATLFDEIPASLHSSLPASMPSQVTEMEIARVLHERAGRDAQPVCFIGAGAYDHHIPAAVWELTTRGEFYSAYTPYQAEASQGTLQVAYEYQTMMVGLTGLDVSNASLYDGASALAEAVLMAVRGNRKSSARRVLMPTTVHPAYRRVTETIVRNQAIQLETVDYEKSGGKLNRAALERWSGEDVTALVIQQPNFFGCLEEVDELVDWAHAHDALVIALVNPVALAVLAPPGEWGQSGADIACGEGQPLGIPLSSGGPYFGFMVCKNAYVRQMPGRIVGRTVDVEGRPGYTLTLQPREQHIRRSKATSNICTNQGLMVTAATLYMSLLGAVGLERVAAACHANTRSLLEAVAGIEGVRPAFTGPRFHEAVLQLDAPAGQVLERMAGAGVLGGYDLGQSYPELGQAILVCATEKRTDEDTAAYARAMQKALRVARRA